MTQKNYSVIDLPFKDNLLHWFNNHFIIEKNLKSAVFTVKLPNYLINIINEFFCNKKLENISENILCFYRTNSEININDLHVDGNGSHIDKCSIVIPIFGYKNSYQYWYDGFYEINTIKSLSGVQFNKVNWLNSPIIIDRCEIISPTLCRVDIPHNAISNGIEPRLTCTFRLKNNPSFEEVLDKLL